MKDIPYPCLHSNRRMLSSYSELWLSVNTLSPTFTFFSSPSSSSSSSSTPCPCSARFQSPSPSQSGFQSQTRSLMSQTQTFNSSIKNLVQAPTLTSYSSYSSNSSPFRYMIPKYSNDSESVTSCEVDIERYLAFILEMPVCDTSELWGMYPTADLTIQQKEVRVTNLRIWIV